MFIQYMIYLLLFLGGAWFLGNKFLVLKEEKEAPKIAEKREELDKVKSKGENLKEEIVITEKMGHELAEITLAKKKLERLNSVVHLNKGDKDEL